MHVVVIGGTGHIGSYLVPRLVRLGHDVTVVTRGEHEPYRSEPAWEQVQRVQVDRVAAEREGVFGKQIAQLRGDVVIDLLCFRIDSARQIVDALRGEVQQLVHCGTIWVHGYSAVVPTTEDQRREPFGEYGVLKYEVERYLQEQAHRYGFPVAIVHPGHVVGAGWAPVGPTACHDIGALAKLARGEELALPNLGMETVHHVHADDVAQVFLRAMTHWSQAVGESFFAVSTGALTLRGYAEAIASWFGQRANLTFLPMDAWIRTVPEAFRESAMAHLTHSSNFSPAKARRMLGYQPRYTSLEATYESIMWLVEHGQLPL